MTPTERRSEVHCIQCGRITDHIFYFAKPSGQDYQECLLCNSRTYVSNGATQRIVPFCPDTDVAEKVGVILKRLGIAADSDIGQRISGAVQFAFDDWASDRDPKTHDGYMR